MSQTISELNLKDLQNQKIIFVINYRTNLSLEEDEDNKENPKNKLIPRYESEEISYADECHATIKEITDNKKSGEKMLILESAIKIGHEIQLGALIFSSRRKNWHGLYVNGKNQKTACCFHGEVKLCLDGQLYKITCPEPKKD